MTTRKKKTKETYFYDFDLSNLVQPAGVCGWTIIILYFFSRVFC